MDTHFSLVVALATFRMSNGDYSCICNYNQDIAVYNETSNSSFLMGHMYEFDCKAAGSPTGMAGWASVLFQHQLGYVQLVDNMEQQSCPGATPIGDDLTTSNPPTIQTTTTEDLTTLLPTTTTPVPTTLPPSTAAPFTSVQTDQSTTATTTQPPTTAAPSTTVMTDQATTTTTSSTYLSPVAGVHYGCEETLFLHAASHDSKLFTISQTCYELVREAVSWTDAENDCKSRGGHLVHIENDEQQNKIYEVVKQYHDDHVWIGLNDREHEETFVWSSGNSVNYTHWYPGRKTNLPLNEDCVAMWMDHGGQWEDVHCSPNLLYNAHAYVCEFDAINDMMTTTPDENSLINTDGIMQLCKHEQSSLGTIESVGQFGRSCYSFYTDIEIWVHAERTCEQDGGHLVQINDEHEQRFVEAFMMRHNPSSPVWIGLNDRKNEGQFVWTDGQAVNYANWLPGHVTHGSDEDCVALLPSNNGSWDDFSCGTSGFLGFERGERHHPLCEFAASQILHGSILVG